MATELTRQPAPFLFLDLPAELRNRIYDLVAAGDGAPTALRHVEQDSERVAMSDDMLAMSYRMGLAQVCAQIRHEYHAIYIRDAQVSVCMPDLDDFLGAFYTANTAATNGPRNISVCLCHESHEMPLQLFDVLPLLKIRMADASFKFDFHVEPGCLGEKKMEFWDPRCKISDEFCKIEDGLWIAELRKGTFSKIDLLYAISHDDTDVGLEFSDPTLLKNSQEMDRVRSILPKRDAGWRYCALVWQIEHQSWDHMEDLLALDL